MDFFQCIEDTNRTWLGSQGTTAAFVLPDNITLVDAIKQANVTGLNIYLTGEGKPLLALHQRPGWLRIYAKD